MGNKTTLKLYVVVDEDGYFDVSGNSMEDAEELYNDNVGDTIAAKYEIDFIIPTPNVTKPVRVEITAPDTPNRNAVPETFSNVRVLPPDGDY